MAPPVKKPGAPASSTSICASRWQRIAAIGRAQRREREAIGGGAGRHPEGADLGPEQVGEGAVEPPAPLVAVIGRVEPVGGGDRLDHLGVRRRRIVGEEAHGCARNGGGPARQASIRLVVSSASVADFRACAFRRLRFSRSAAASRSSRSLSLPVIANDMALSAAVATG